MKSVRFITGIMVLGLAAGCFEKTDSTPGTASTILYRHHFLGTAHLAHDTNAAKIPAILAMPATREFSDVVLQKLARSPEELWRKFLPAGAAAQPALVRPLLDDLVSAESYAMVHGPLHQGESVLAIELNEDRAGLWRTNLGGILTAWKLGTPSPLTLGEAKGWEIKRAEGPALIQFVRGGQWVLIGLGKERLSLLPALLEEIRKSGRPVASQTNVLLEVEADFPRLGEWLPAIRQYRLPHTHLTLFGRGAYLRTEAELHFSDPIPWIYEPWKIPSNFVRDPVISFTALRGFGPLLSQVKGVPALGLQPTPNQICAWCPGMVHAETFFSIPMANPSNVVARIGPKLPDFIKELFGQTIGGFTLVSNRSELLWQGWPVLLPHLAAAQEGDTGYLAGGLFPIPPMTNAPPPELFDQLKGRTNLVYYDWEITQPRLVHARQLQQIWDIMNHRALAPTNAPDQKWLIAAGPHLANTITEATLSSPRGLTIVRKSDFGLAAFELATLTRWMASAGFPWTFEPPPSILRSPGTPESGTNAPPFPSPGGKRN